MLDTNNVVGSSFRQQAGVIFGIGEIGRGDAAGFEQFPDNLDQFIFFGPDDSVFGSLVGNSTPAGNAGLLAIEYTLRSNSERFSEFALTSTPRDLSGNTASGEQAGLFLRSEIYAGVSDQLAGVVELSTIGMPATPPSFFTQTRLVGSQSIPLDSDLIRVVTYGLVLAPFEGQIASPFGDESSSLNSFFNEFSTIAIPEPGSLGIMLGTVAMAGLTRRRKRQ